jgi:hypothetical protein
VIPHSSNARALLACLAIALLPMAPAVVCAQDAVAPKAASLDRPLRVFIDCRGPGCDQEFFRRELTWVDHVRDQKDADVHLLITSQGTGGGGTEYHLRFIGHGQWEAQEDTLRRSVEAGDTDDQRRRALLQIFSLGLARFAAATPVGPQLKITPPADAARPVQSAAAEDPWNLWVFRTNINVNMDGEALSSFKNFNANQSANRTTNAWKINVNGGMNYNESRYVLEEEDAEGEFISTRKGWNVNGLAVKSLTDRWSVGGRAGASRSTFLNQKLAARVAGGGEFNIFPYAQSSERSWIVQWTAGITRFVYDEITIYERTEETKWSQSLVSELDLRQPYGTIGLAMQFANYLDDPSVRRFSIEVDNDIRVTRGFSVRVFGEYESIHDQLFLKRGEATNEEIIARQQQLQTSYRYFISVGITYRFGSINNNVVNTRFNSGGLF